MPKCNLFRDISKETGTFFTFSQYSEDLTKHFTNPNKHKVVPSKYICLNLLPQTNTTGNLNIEFPELLQNYFENKCSFLRNIDGENYPFAPSDTLELFFSTLRKGGYIKIEKEEQGDINRFVDISNVVKYIGDINLYSYNESDGMGYNEIYCYVPADAKEIKTQEFKQVVSESSSTTSISYGTSEGNSILGWSDLITRYNSLLSYDAKFDGTGGGNTYTYKSGYEPRLDGDIEYTENNKFIFNAILVLYDVCDEEGNVVPGHQNIPMGLYITGLFNSGGNRSLQNPITKFITNNDIYGQGTSYGLRIMSRFLAMPNNSQIAIDTTASSDDMGISTYAGAVSTMTRSMEKMDAILNQSTIHTNNISEHLKSFMSNRTNVPYIRKVEGVDYWFVNGRNTNTRVNMSDMLSFDESFEEGSNNLVTSGMVFDGLKSKIDKIQEGDYEEGELVKFGSEGELLPSGLVFLIGDLGGDTPDGQVFLYDSVRGEIINSGKQLSTIIQEAIDKILPPENTPDDSVLVYENGKFINKEVSVEPVDEP